MAYKYTNVYVYVYMNIDSSYFYYIYTHTSCSRGDGREAKACCHTWTNTDRPTVLATLTPGRM